MVNKADEIAIKKKNILRLLTIFRYFDLKYTLI